MPSNEIFLSSVLIFAAIGERRRCPAVGGAMRRVIAALMAGSLLLLGVACDDNEEGGAQNEKIDEDDTRVGPGDGKDEVGPGR
jgi:hypothetical protein